MKFYDTGNTHDSLVHYVNDLLNLSSGDVTIYTLAQKARATNTAKYKLALQMIRASAAWSWEDNQKSDLPIATTTLVVGQRDYTLPTAAIGIERVEVMDAGGNYFRLIPMDETEIQHALTNYGESNGTPTHYWVKGRSLFLDIAPATGSVTLAAGIKVYYAREIDEFSAATTTTEVGFEEPGDRAIACMVAEEFAGRYPGYDRQLKFIESELYGAVVNGKVKIGLLELCLGQQSSKLKDMKPRFRLARGEEDME